MNTKAKGARNERRSKKLLEALGYQVTKSGGSLGVFDLIAFSSQDILLCQIKTSDWPSAQEIQAIQTFACPSNCKKQIHRWKKCKRTPEVKEVGNG